MFLLVTAIGVICAVVVWKMVPAIQQKNAVSALRGNGAVVRYDFEESYSYVDTKGRPQPEPTPGWAASVLGVDAVHDVTRVQLNETGFRDHDEFEKAVYTLRYLPRLGWLDILASREIKDDALRSITGLRQLYCLNLSVGHLSDVALRYVSVLDGLIDLCERRGGHADAGDQRVLNEFSRKAGVVTNDHAGPRGQAVPDHLHCG
jgi:hypothetical protein